MRVLGWAQWIPDTRQPPDIFCDNRQNLSDIEKNLLVWPWPGLGWNYFLGAVVTQLSACRSPFPCLPLFLFSPLSLSLFSFSLFSFSLFSSLLWHSLQLQPISLLSASLSWSWRTPFCARWWSPLMAGGDLPSRATLPASCPTTSCSPNTPLQLNTWSKEHDAQSKILSNWSKD